MLFLQKISKMKLPNTDKTYNSIGVLYLCILSTSFQRAAPLAVQRNQIVLSLTEKVPHWFLNSFLMSLWSKSFQFFHAFRVKYIINIWQYMIKQCMSFSVSPSRLMKLSLLPPKSSGWQLPNAKARLQNRCPQTNKGTSRRVYTLLNRSAWQEQEEKQKHFQTAVV